MTYASARPAQAAAYFGSRAMARSYMSMARSESRRFHA